MGRVLSHLVGFVLLVLVVLVFNPLLFLGRLLRALGTLICNLAFWLLEGIEWLGEWAALRLPS